MQTLPDLISTSLIAVYQHFKGNDLSLLSITLCDNFVEVGDGDIGSVVAVAWIWLCEAVHVQQLPVGHLPVGVKYLLAFTNGAHADHLQTVLRNMECMRR